MRRPLGPIEIPPSRCTTIFSKFLNLILEALQRMTLDIETPSLLVYSDGTGRLVNPAALPTSLEDVRTRYMEGDLLIDARGRVFRLSHSDGEACLIAILAGAVAPVDVTDTFTASEVDAILANVVCNDPRDVEMVVSAIQRFRNATW